MKGHSFSPTQMALDCVLMLSSLESRLETPLPGEKIEVDGWRSWSLPGCLCQGELLWLMSKAALEKITPAERSGFRDVPGKRRLS